MKEKISIWLSGIFAWTLILVVLPVITLGTGAAANIFFEVDLLMILFLYPIAVAFTALCSIFIYDYIGKDWLQIEALKNILRQKNANGSTAIEKRLLWCLRIGGTPFLFVGLPFFAGCFATTMVLRRKVSNVFNSIINIIIFFFSIVISAQSWGAKLAVAVSMLRYVLQFVGIL